MPGKKQMTSSDSRGVQVQKEEEKPDPMPGEGPRLGLRTRQGCSEVSHSGADYMVRQGDIEVQSEGLDRTCLK